MKLTRVFRQKDQGSCSLECLWHCLETYNYIEFVDMLNALRLGKVNPKITEEFKRLSRPIVYEDGIEATAL